MFVYYICASFKLRRPNDHPLCIHQTSGDNLVPYLPLQELRICNSIPSVSSWYKSSLSIVSLATVRGDDVIEIAVRSRDMSFDSGGFHKELVTSSTFTSTRESDEAEDEGRYEHFRLAECF